MSSVLPTISDKPRYVAAMFGRIAGRYDLMNGLITLGQDARWRRVVAEALPASTKTVLDVGSGTGRLAWAVRYRRPNANVVAADFALPMLRRAPRQLSRVGADATRLPFADQQFEAVVSGFVVRNLADIDRGLQEQIRVLKPGGTLVILETTPGPQNTLLRPPYRVYFRYVVPLLGGLIAGDSSAYTYLPESTLAFLEPNKLADRLRAHGLQAVRTRPLMLGCVAVTTGTRPAMLSAGVDA